MSAVEWHSLVMLEADFSEVKSNIEVQERTKVKHCSLLIRMCSI